jgi:hypothetical protein
MGKWKKLVGLDVKLGEFMHWVTIVVTGIIFVLIGALIVVGIVSVGRERIATGGISALGWAADHWFQILVLLFMARVWVGLSVVNRFVKGMYTALVKDDLSQLLRDFKSSRQSD